jgi:hypothetical protein
MHKVYVRQKPLSVIVLRYNMNLTQLTIRDLSANEIAPTLKRAIPKGSLLIDLKDEAGKLLDAIAHGERVESSSARLRELVPPHIDVRMSELDLGEHATRFPGAQGITLSEVSGPRIFVRLRGSQNMFTVFFEQPTPVSSLALHVTCAAGDAGQALLWDSEGGEIIGDALLERSVEQSAGT